MASLTVRNIPEEAKLRFRQVAAAHGRSMEEHLRQLVIGTQAAEAPQSVGMHDAKQEFRHEPPTFAPQNSVASDTDRAAFIRAMSSAEFFSYLVETAGGVGLDLPPRANFGEGREVFGAD